MDWVTALFALTPTVLLLAQGTSCLRRPNAPLYVHRFGFLCSVLAGLSFLLGLLLASGTLVWPTITASRRQHYMPAFPLPNVPNQPSRPARLPCSYPGSHTWAFPASSLQGSKSRVELLAEYSTAKSLQP